MTTGQTNDGAGRSSRSSIRPAPTHHPPPSGRAGWRRLNGAAGRPCPRTAAPQRSRAHAEFEKRFAEETRKSFETGRERGHQEGRQAERAGPGRRSSAAEEHRKRQAAELLESFAQERDRYLHAVEHEVVKLALAVAARILRREAQMDPLLLTGAVRVALGQLSGTTQVRLRVPPDELDLWTEAIALLPNLP